MTEHETFMRYALNQAKIAQAHGDVPVGAVLVRNGEIIGRGRNQREQKQDPAGHAEIEALRDAAALTGAWRLRGTSLYCTLEPCIMCAGALVHAQVEHLYYGVPDSKAGGVESLYQLLEDARLNHQVLVHGGILAEDCEQLLKDFFAELR